MAFNGSVWGFILATMLRAIIIFGIVEMSSTNMHNAMTEKVLRSGVLFFDSNPTGRIVTRFSKDMSVIDMVIPIFAIFVTQGLFRTLFVLVTVSIINPWLLIGCFIGGGLLYYYMTSGNPAMMDSQRLDGILRAPIHSTFGMVVNGLVTLRAFNKISYFKQDFSNDLEKCANVTFCYIVANRWMGVRFDTICSLFIGATCLLSILMKGTVPTEQIAITLQIMIDMISMFSVSIRMYAEFKNYMTSS